jgi:hypothetical protein
MNAADMERMILSYYRDLATFETEQILNVTSSQLEGEDLASFCHMVEALRGTPHEVHHAVASIAARALGRLRIREADDRAKHCTPASHLVAMPRSLGADGQEIASASAAAAVDVDARTLLGTTEPAGHAPSDRPPAFKRTPR